MARDHPQPHHHPTNAGFRIDTLGKPNDACLQLYCGLCKTSKCRMPKESVKIPRYIRAIRASRALPSLRRPWLARPAHTHKWLRKSIQFTLKSIPSSPQTFQRQSIRESPKIQRKSKSPKIILSMSLGYFCTLAVQTGTRIN